MTDEIIDFNPESSILFLGSGFSLGATNIAGGNPPNGKGLRRHFIERLKFPQDTEYDLQVLSEEFADRDPQKLRDELYEIFRLTELTPEQKSILNEPWRRIYSTNYDDAVEVHRINKRVQQNAFDISEAVPNKLPHGAVVHLHGSIRLITPETVTTSLVLGEKSYVNQYVKRSPWYDQFQRDLTFASAIYIVGYSLADYHISALLMADPKLAERTVFIQGPTPDEIFLRRTAQYGRTLFIGTDGFAEVLSRTKRSDTPSLESLRSFRSLAPIRDNKSSARPTASEVFDLLVYGDFDAGRLARSQPSEDYAIARKNSVISAAEAIETKASLIVDGRLGNGKTIFLHLLAFELSSRGWTCLNLRPGNPEIQREIAALAEIERVVIFVDQYSAAQDSLRGLREALPKAKFVVEVRTGTFEVRYYEFTKLLPQPLDRVSLNAITRHDLEALSWLCERAGLRTPPSDHRGDLRDLLLELFENEAVRNRIKSALAPLFESRATQRILTMTMLIATHQTSVSASFVRSVTGEDPFLVLKPMEDLSHEIFEASADRFKARSAIFSSFVISSFISAQDISDAVVEVTLAAAQWRKLRPYRILMSNMMTYSSLIKILHGKGNTDAIITGIYERLRHDERVNKEPLFWLQYAILMTEKPRLDTADEYIATAYRKAEDLPGFQTYQIDTQAFRIALLRATQQKSGQAVFNITEILEGIEVIDKMLGDESHRSYAVKVLNYVQPFVTARLDDLAAGERTALQFWLLKLVKSLNSLPDEFKTVADPEPVRKSIEAAAAMFVE